MAELGLVLVGVLLFVLIPASIWYDARKERAHRKWMDDTQALLDEIWAEAPKYGVHLPPRTGGSG